VGSKILLKILKDNLAEEFVSLRRDYFNKDDLFAYDAIHDYFEKYGKLPSVDFVVKNKIIEIDDVTEDYEYLRDELIKNYVAEKVDNLISVATNLKKVDPIKAIDAVKESLTEIDLDVNAIGKDVYTFSDLSEEIVNELKSLRSTKGITGIPTGWSTFDRLTAGYQKGDVYAVVARVKTGKSMFMLYSANACHEAGYIPMMISMEMKVKHFARRHLALKTKIDYNFYKTGQLSSITEKMIKRDIKKLKDQHPFYYVEGQLKKSINDIYSLVVTYKPDILFIDGGYLLDIPHRTTQRWEAMELLMKHIKSIAMRLSLPVVVSFQLNREALKKKVGEVGMEHIRLSDDIGAIASVVVGIFETAPEDEDVLDEGLIPYRYIDVLGGRDGEAGGFYINWNWENMDFSEIDKSELNL